MEPTGTEVYRQLLRTDFYNFILRSFYQLNQREELKENWHLEVIAAKLEACRLGKVRRLIINLPPRHLKSLCASVAFPAWCLGHDPAAQIMCVSYAQELSDNLSRQCRGVMMSNFYKRMFRTRLSRQKQSVGEFETTSHGYRFATSVGGVLTGRGANLIIIDDPLKAEEARSETLRKRVNDWYDSTLYSRLNKKDRDCIILIMQRLHEDDLVGHVLEQENWEVVSFSAIAERDEEYIIETPLGRRRFTRRVDDVLHPQWESRETLEQLRNMDEYNFAGQYQQAPAPLGGGLIKEEWFAEYAPSERPERFDLIMQSWDTANKVTELSDYSVCTTWGLKGRQIYLLDVFRRRLEYPDLKRAVLDRSRSYNANVVLIEDTASGTQLIQELTREGARGITPCKPQQDKVMRLYAQTGQIEDGSVLLPQNAPWRAEYLRELTTFPNGKYDDQADSTSQALLWISQRRVEPSNYVAMRRKVVMKLKRDGVPTAEIAAQVRKTPEEVQSMIDEEQRRVSPAPSSNRVEQGRGETPAKRWNPWMGTPVPK
jgi:predicted phage terminase large subunit-like protein